MTTTHDALPTTLAEQRSALPDLLIGPDEDTANGPLVMIHRRHGVDRMVRGDYWRIQTTYGKAELDPFVDPCPPWCDDAPHMAERLGEDRLHTSAQVLVVTERAEADDQGDGTIVPGFLNLYLRQLWNEREPVVRLALGESGDGADLTLDEADLLADVLTTLVGKARGTADDPASLNSPSVG